MQQTAGSLTSKAMQISSFNLKTRITVFLVLIAAFCLLTVLVKSGNIAAFEISIHTKITRYSPIPTAVMKAISNFGAVGAIVAIVLVLLALPVTRTNVGVPVAIVAAASSVLNNLLKVFIARDRPETHRLVDAAGYGFPSGHAMNNTALYTMIIISVFRMNEVAKARILVFIFGFMASFLIGVSRVYLGVHNTGDVLAGWIMGAAVALLVDTVYVVLA